MNTGQIDRGNELNWFAIFFEKGWMGGCNPNV